MRYHDIEPIERAAAESLISAGNVEALRFAVVSVALHEPDCAWAEAFCTRLARHADPIVRGNAILGFGHIARLHSRLNLAIVEPLIHVALADEDEHVRGQAESAADDIATFLGVQVRRVH